MFINYRDISKFDLTKTLNMSTKDESSTQLLGELAVMFVDIWSNKIFKYLGN